MKLKKDGKKIELTNKVQIKAFKQAGWEEVKENAPKAETEEKTEAESETEGSSGDTDSKSKGKK